MSTQFDPLRTTAPELHNFIIIAGDSWGTGECGGKVRHRGLEQYLVDANYPVLNTSKSGSSNLDTLNRLSWSIDIIQSLGISVASTKILVFQTEWSRDFRMFYDAALWPWVNPQSIFYAKFDKYDDQLPAKIISQWYHRLSDLSQHCGANIHLIGGCSDTLWVDDFEKHYPGVQVACQSLTNLLLTGDHRIQDPILQENWTEEFLANCMDTCTDTFSKNQLLDHVELSNQRIKIWGQNPQWFWPDGRHANRAGHKILFEHLKTNGII